MVLCQSCGVNTSSGFLLLSLIGVLTVDANVNMNARNQVIDQPRLNAKDNHKTASKQ